MDHSARRSPPSTPARTASIFVALLTLACSEDLAKPAVSADQSPTRPSIATTMLGDAMETRVDATRTDAWIHIDLETQAEIPTAEASASSAWDLAFQRFKVKSNGGVSGAGGVEVAVLPQAELDTISAAPDVGWLVDEQDGPDMNPDPDTVFNRGDDPWFDYDGATHVLAPKKRIYVVRTAAGNHFAVQIVKYYDPAGTAGLITFRWKMVNAPAMRIPASPSMDAGAVPSPMQDAGVADAADTAGTIPDAEGAETTAPDSEVYGIAVEATSPTNWTYVKLGVGATTVSDPTQTTWDLGFSLARVRTNGGTSGIGMGAARLGPPGVGFDEVSKAPPDGFEVDRLLPNPGPPGSGESSGNPVLSGWYDYDPATHRATPKDLVYLVRTAAGSYGKLRVLSYSRGSYRIRFEPISGPSPAPTSP